MGGVGEEAWEQCPALGRVRWARDCVLKKNGSGWRGKQGWGQRCSAKEKEETAWTSADEKEEVFQLLMFIFASGISQGVRAWWELSFTVGVLDGKACGRCLTWPSTYAGGGGR